MSEPAWLAMVDDPQAEAHLFVVDAASYFVNRIKKGETDVHTG